MFDTSSPVLYVQVGAIKPRVTESQINAAQVAVLQAKLTDRQKYQRTLESVGGTESEIAAVTAEISQIQAQIVSIATTDESILPDEKPSDAEVIEILSERVVSFSYEDDEKKTDLVKITLDNSDLALFDESVLLEKGTLLTVAWGYPGRMAPAREAVVQKVRGFMQLTIEAEDKAVLLHKILRTRVFENTTRSKVVEQIADSYGFGAASRRIQSTETAYGAISQAAQTDAQFIKKLADLEGFEFYLDVDGLHWHERDLTQAPARVLQYYLPPEVGDIVSISMDNDVAAKPGKVVVRGRDPLSHKDVEEVADDSTVERTTLAGNPEIVPSEVFDPETLGSTFSDAARSIFTQNSTSRLAERGSAVDAGSAEVRPTTETDPKAAKSEAAGTFKRAQQSAVQFSLKIIGDPYLAAKSIVELRGISKRFSGSYYITSANHSLSGSGYSMEIKCRSDGTNSGSTGSAGASKAGSSAAEQNTKKAPDEVKDAAGGPGNLTEVEVFNPETLESETEYHDKGSSGEAAPPKGSN